MKMSFIALLFASISLLHTFADTTYGCELGQGSSKDGLIKVIVSEANGHHGRGHDASPNLSKLSTLKIKLESKTSGLLDQVSKLRFDARMPDHNHGMVTKPVVTKKSASEYTVQGVKLHMPGAWIFYVDLTRDAKSEIINIPFDHEIAKPFKNPVVVAESGTKNTLQVPDFSLTDQNGNTIGKKDFTGKVWVANFIYTQCGDICPLMTQKLAGIQNSNKSPKLTFASITVDPEHDTSQVLKDYSKKFGADDNRWRFLTGPKKAIVALSVGGFKLSAGDSPRMHSGRFVLVNPAGDIEGYYNSDDTVDIMKLKNDINNLLAKLSS